MSPPGASTESIQSDPSREKQSQLTTQSTQRNFSSTRIHPNNVPVSQTAPTLQPLEIVPRKAMVFDSSRTLGLTISSPLSPPLHSCVTAFLHAIGLAGFVLSAYGVVCISQEREHGLMISVLALVMTSAFMAPFVLSYQRTALRTMLSSFDVAFLSVQAVLGWIGFSLAICWDVRSVASFLLVLWILFMLMVDALTPNIRARYRFRKSYLTPVVLLLVISTVGLLATIASPSIEPYLPDRNLVCARMFGHEHCLHTASFILQRLVTLVLSTVQAMWTLAFSDDSELVFLRTVVRFTSPVEMLPFHRNLQVDSTTR